MQLCKRASNDHLWRSEREIFLVFVIYRKNNVEMAGINYLGATARKRNKKGAATRSDEIAMI